ncbi:CRISPR-associated helicase Cas3' [Leucobacter insecticola]|uniref:CRISPR-associated helicase Cas3 n=1 Tax=Leucobacter insecticola TaxID=2714934 RepID=A0A6G8FGX3_9MICO|nr:CRISPR-associated helicase Cas3' [Leucobacter insecticola]QIM15756.1 CRISPR-associated helicase Cas3' [Leucobacter insecticola]
MKSLPKPTDPMVRAAWAKSQRDGSKPFPLYAHLEDTAAVADHLFERWLSKSQRALLARSFGDEATAHRVAIWLAASHDVGKATWAFAIKVPEGRRQMEDVGFLFPEPTPPYSDQRLYPHGLAGQLAVERHFDTKTARPKARAGLLLAEIIGGHHGSFPAVTDNPSSIYREGAGEPAHWAHVRNELLHRADQIAEITDDDWAQILQARIPESVQAILNGFLIVCDWIASNEWMFPYDASEPANVRAERGLSKLNLGNSWLPTAASELDAYFGSRFGISDPRPSQHDAHELAASLDEPSLLLIEAPTGEGKTETAFACAETLAAKFGLNGVAVLLPTRATASAMFGRTLDWLNSRADAATPQSVTLAHSKAEFDDRFQRLSSASKTAHIYDDEQGTSHSVVANQWFRGRKQRVLADFVVATIDQMLFMALKAKHMTLRHLGFGGKVVIIDEVHAADTFMRTYLLRALQWLGAYQVPVIALSATLPEAQRLELLSAYREGARQTIDRAVLKVDPKPDAELTTLAQATGYPLITAVGAHNHAQRVSQPSGRRIAFTLDEASDESMLDQVSAAVADGGCIAVVMNTVNRAQRVFADLAARHPGMVELYHSRFTVESRARREQRLVERLGRSAADRPNGLIVVATQVVESSLDVDFDLMFTDIAPMDSLVQRIGRVHRHDRGANRPESMREPRVVLTGGERLLSGEAPPTFDRGVQRVYGEALLLRTVAALREHLGQDTGASGASTTLAVPDDVPLLIKNTYRPAPTMPADWLERHEEAERIMRLEQHDQQERSRQFVVRHPGLGKITDWNALAQSEASEEHLGAAQVRDAELSLEVVLVQRVGGGVKSLPSLGAEFGGQEVALTGGIDDDLARAVATCAVSLPAWMTQGSQLDMVINSLESSGIESWQMSPWLRGVLPLILDENFCCTLGINRVQYSDELGLTVEREDAR